jgi:DNA-binding SARP family transcriptional activator
VRLRGRKIEALCTYLVVTNAPVSRDTLRALLWPRARPTDGRHNLSQALSRLRAHLRDFHADPLIDSPEGVRLPGGLITTDLLVVERLLRRNSPESLRVASQLCYGEFLAGTNINETGFDRWIAAQRARARELASETYWRWINALIERDRTEEALLAAFRLVKIEPLNERGHLVLMSSYAKRGQIGAALRHYDSFARQLEAAGQTKPGAEMESLRQRLGASTETSQPPARDSAVEGNHRRRD